MPCSSVRVVLEWRDSPLLEAPSASAFVGLAQKRWVLLGRDEEITFGKAHSFNVAGEEVVAYRASDGGLSIFEAHCPHQGAHLGRGRRLEDDCLSCPFHQFYFNAREEFVGTKPEGKPKPHMSLHRVEHRLSDDRVEVFV